MFDIGSIIVWKSNNDLVSIIESTFKERILLKQSFDIRGEERRKLLIKLYDPIIPPNHDERYFQTEEITLFLVKLNPSQEFLWRTEGYRICNKEILNFKNLHRQRFSFVEFHCSDNITECNKSIEVFNVNFNTKKEIVDVDDLYHFIHGDGIDIWDCYRNKKFNLVPISNTPVVKYLQGYENVYHSQSFLFIKREDSIKYHLNNYDFKNINHEIHAIKYGNKYVVCDGMHRSSILYFFGNRKILVNIVDEEGTNDSFFMNYISEKDIPSEIKKSHWNSLYKFLFELKNKQIRWVCIRGFRKMPKSPDTDLDIVIHPDDYDKFLSIMDDFVKKELFKINHKNTRFLNKKTNLFYSAFSTVGTDGDLLPNGCFQLDVYNDLFFFKGNEGVKLNQYFLHFLFNHVIEKNTVIIPSLEYELVLLICRVYIDKGGHWNEKHKNIFNTIKNDSNFNVQKFKELLNYGLTDADFFIDFNIDTFQFN